MALIAFAGEVSGGSLPVVEEVAGLFDPLSRQEEVVGFYLSGDEPDDEIACRSTITVLEKHGLVNTYEDKYLNEMPWLLLNSKRLKKGAKLSSEARKFINNLSDADEGDYAQMDTVAVDYFKQLEKLANEKGLYYLHVNFHAGSGDTEFIIPVNGEVYEKWLNVQFTDEVSIEAVQWVLIWDTISLYTYDQRTALDWEQPTLRTLDTVSQ